MPIKGKRYEFNATNINRSPAKAGVYALYSKSGELIYVGRSKGGTTTIRSRLQCHLSGDEETCTQGASFYRREAMTSPVSREKELLEEYERILRKLPRCNERRA